MSLSSAESEYYSMVRCASEAIGLANTMRGSGTRTGSPKRELRNQGYGNEVLWLQQKEKNLELRIEKIRGTVNNADLMRNILMGNVW